MTKYFRSRSRRLNPSSPHSASKPAADRLVNAYHITCGADVVVTRSTNNYGPNQHPEKLIPRLITNALRGKRLPIYGTGENVRDWIFVEDNCRAILTAMEKGEKGQIYNIAGGNEKKNVEIAKEILQRLSLPDGTIRRRNRSIGLNEGDRPGHDFRSSLRCDKILGLGWKPGCAFDEGLQKTIDWYEANNRWSRPLVEHKR